MSSINIASELQL